ncbi:MAG: ABC transporter permease [Clostridia bacterium]|nr:ABC transporter permease [Clostridia bacterium]
MNNSPAKKKPTLTTEGFLGILVIVIMIALYFATHGSFFSAQNLINVARVWSYLFIAGIGMTMIIITGNIDISYGAVISVISIVMAAISKIDDAIPWYVFIPAGMVTGAILCGFNAWMMAKFRIPSMVITLATTQIYYGALLLFLEGSIYNLRSNWTWIYNKANYFNGYVPLLVIIALVLLIIAVLFFRYSRFLKKLYAIGNNRQGAIYAGVNVNRTLIITYMIGGALLALSATLLATSGKRVTCTVGTGVEMKVIAATVVGGTSAIGGSGNVYGTALGALLLAIISPALTQLGIDTNWTDFFTGVIIVSAIIVSALKNLEKPAGKKA